MQRDEYTHWRIDVDDRIATLTLNRADQLNSLDAGTLHELRELSARLAADRSVWAVVLRPAGDHFSAGMDVSVIGGMAGSEEDAFRANLRDLQDCLDQFEALEKPTIAAVRGYCLGGGLILALCCDLRIAAEDAIFGLPEVKRSVGVIMGTQRIVRVTGAGIAKQIILTAENFSAEEALRFGLVHRVVPAEALEAAAHKQAAHFRNLPPRAVGIAKRIVDRGQGLSIRDSQALEADSQAELLDSPDFREAVDSFFEKRPPRYTGDESTAKRPKYR
ncbi:MAG: enoyl-CoA hydratase/isomerase family protein [Anaerolineales bacterium]